MNHEHTEAIETCFAKFPHGGEFMLLDHTCPYRIHSSERVSPSVIYTTKFHTSQKLWPSVAPDSEVIGRPGLPDEQSLRWLKEHVGERSVHFLGDFDPPDLLTYVWLRESLPDVDLTYAGISDRFLAACGAEVPENFLINLSADEMEAYLSLRPLIESLASEIGVDCLAIIEQGKKMELEAIVSTISAWE